MERRSDRSLERRSIHGHGVCALSHPTDYARLNQFPEWFTVEEAATYTVTVLEREDETAQALAGATLRNGLPVTLGENDTLRLIVRP